MEGRELAKIKKLSIARLESLVYGLVKPWQFGDSYQDYSEFDRANEMINVLAEKAPEVWGRFSGFLKKMNSARDLQSLLAFLERRQGIQVKDSDIQGLGSETEASGVNSRGSNKPGLKDFENFLAETDSKIPVSLVLEDIRSSFNIGSAFRLAECLGFEKIYLTGYTATPDNAKVETSAMGTENLVPWEYVESAEELLKNFKSKSVKNLALETSAGAMDICDFSPVKGEAYSLWLGNERFGFNENFLDSFDAILSIPLYGAKNSLNVVSAASMAGFHINNKLRGLT